MHVKEAKRISAIIMTRLIMASTISYFTAPLIFSRLSGGRKLPTAYTSAAIVTASSTTSMLVLIQSPLSIVAKPHICNMNPVNIPTPRPASACLLC